MTDSSNERQIYESGKFLGFARIDRVVEAGDQNRQFFPEKKHDIRMNRSGFRFLILPEKRGNGFASESKNGVGDWNAKIAHGTIYNRISALAQFLKLQKRGGLMKLARSTGTRFFAEDGKPFGSESVKARRVKS